MKKFRDKETGEIIMETENVPDDLSGTLEEVKTLCVCNQCLSAIEAHEGRQLYKKHYIPESVTCDWCELETYDEINELI